MSYDPWVAASDPKLQTFANEYWGEVFIDCWGCALEKGVGKVPHDPLRHSRPPLTAVKVEIEPLPEMDLDFPVLREEIAEFKPWVEIVWASLKELGLTNIAELKNKYAKVILVPTGRKYLDSNGEQKEATTFRFVKLFKDQSECKADYLSGNGGTPAYTEQVSSGDTDGKNAALQFLQVIVQNAARGQTDIGVVRETVATQIAGLPVVKKHFTVDSPETNELILKEMTK